MHDDQYQLGINILLSIFCQIVAHTNTREQNILCLQTNSMFLWTRAQLFKALLA